MTDRPTFIIGSAVSIRQLRLLFQRADEQAFEQAVNDVMPTHFVRTADQQIGMGSSYAAAFSDLVRTVLSDAREG